MLKGHGRQPHIVLFHFGGSGGIGVQPFGSRVVTRPGNSWVLLVCGCRVCWWGLTAVTDEFN